jgi:hypothetical protein
MTRQKALVTFNEIRDIILFGRDSADIYEYFVIGKPLQKEEEEIINWNWFLRHSANVNLHTALLQLSKLFPDPSSKLWNNHYAFRKIIHEIRTDKLMADDKLKSVEDYLTELEIIPETNKRITRTKLLQIWRDKVIAHTDTDRHDYS